MKILFDLFPLLIFFGAFKFYDIYVATGAAIIATFIQVAVFWLKNRRFESMHIMTLVIVTLFGGLTILLKDDLFIKWKPTVVNWIFCGVIVGMLLFAKKTALEYVMGKQIALSATAWKNLNRAWALFFLAMGCLNLYVAFYYNSDADAAIRTATWVNFKVFGLLGLTLIFIIGQVFFLSKHIKTNEPNQ